MRFGVFGCRHKHIEIAVEQLIELGYTCIGIYEHDGFIAKELSEKYNLPLINDEKDFFAASPEIVLCASINNEKIDVIEKCCSRGIHVMLDKPLVTSFNDYTRLKKITDSGKIQIGLMLTERFNPSVYALKSIIESGELGKLIGFMISKPHKLNPAERESWHFDKKQNGGPIIDLMIHDFDLLRWLTGSEVLSVSGYMKAGNRDGYPEFYDDAKLLLMMENGVTATLLVDWWTPDAYPVFGNGRIICTGTKGKCEVYTTGEPLFQKDEFAILSTQSNEEQIIKGVLPERNLMEDFLERIAGRPSIINTKDIIQATWDTLVADNSCKVIKTKGDLINERV